MHITIGDATYELLAEPRSGRWFAYAVGATTRERFGMECAGETERESLDRLARWLTWQREHSDALGSLQHAEQAYHRVLAGSAFAGPDEPSAVELQKESLDQVEAARMRLDEVRARRPN
ncbi:MAG TPA: hypothetical protein VHZ73_00255 [Vicinamibacterales bacterium]|jgi:hypothetical protein|nr:hypothetical protein [Vicinamibacterales bacterium]